MRTRLAARSERLPRPTSRPEGHPRTDPRAVRDVAGSNVLAVAALIFASCGVQHDPGVQTGGGSPITGSSSTGSGSGPGSGDDDGGASTGAMSGLDGSPGPDTSAAAEGGDTTGATETPVRRLELRRIGAFPASPTPERYDAGHDRALAYAPGARRLYAASTDHVEVIDLADPTAPAPRARIDGVGDPAALTVLDDGTLVVAAPANPPQLPGFVFFVDPEGDLRLTVRVGAGPTAVAATPDGSQLVVANEGEPSGYGITDVDPEGSITIIRIDDGIDGLSPADVTTVDFATVLPADLGEHVRVTGPGATPAEDFEPQALAIAPDGDSVWVALQENNAIAVIDLVDGVVRDLVDLGVRDHSRDGQGLDASDQDGPEGTGAIHIARWPVFGLPQPGGIASFEVAGATYFVTANEGAPRDTPGMAPEAARIAELRLSPDAFADPAALLDPGALGRLHVSRIDGDDNDDDRAADPFDAEGLPVDVHDTLFAFGTRSISIYDRIGNLVWDSGDALERIVSERIPEGFNADDRDAGDTTTTTDTRSDDRGPQPRAVAAGEVGDVPYVFVALAKVGGIVVWDVSDPRAPAFQDYRNDRVFDGTGALGTAGDLGPSGLVFVDAADSPLDTPLLLVGHATSGSTAIYALDQLE